MLRGLFVCDSFRSKVPLATGSPIGMSPFCFLLVPLHFPPVVSSGYFVDSSLVFILLSVSGVNTSFAFSPGFVPLSFSVERSCSLHLSSFSFCSAFLDYCFYLFCPLPSFSVPQWGSWQISSFVGVSPFSLSPSPWSSQRLISSGFILPVFVPALSFALFFVSLVHPLHLACFNLGAFLRFFFVPSSSLSFSPLGGSGLFFRLSEVSHSVSTLSGALLLSFARLSCRLYVLLASTSSLLSHFFHPWLGLMFCCVFLVCLFLLFRFPFHVLWLLLFALAFSLRIPFLLSALGPFYFNSLWGIQFSYPRFSFYVLL